MKHTARLSSTAFTSARACSRNCSTLHWRAPKIAARATASCSGVSRLNAVSEGEDKAEAPTY